MASTLPKSTASCQARRGAIVADQANFNCNLVSGLVELRVNLHHGHKRLALAACRTLLRLDTPKSDRLLARRHTWFDRAKLPRGQGNWGFGASNPAYAGIRCGRRACWNAFSRGAPCPLDRRPV